jgi:hypothetical protein
MHTRHARFLTYATVANVFFETHHGSNKCDADLLPLSIFSSPETMNNLHINMHNLKKIPFENGSKGDSLRWLGVINEPFPEVPGRYVEVFAEDSREIEFIVVPHPPGDFLHGQSRGA